MPVQTEHRFPLDLSVLDAAGSRVTLAGLRGQAHLAAGLHRTLLLQHSGIMLIDLAGVVRYRP